MRLTEKPKVLQLRVSLEESEPEIWRQFLVTDDITLFDLHRVIQVGFGWDDDHLHQFKLRGKSYVADPLQETHTYEDAEDMILADFQLRVLQEFEYIYDFGDWWVHNICIEGEKELEDWKSYPACIGGSRSAPPEDIGGRGGYWNFLERRKSGKLNEYDEGLEDFDPEHFDLQDTDKKLEKHWRGGLPTRV